MKMCPCPGRPPVESRCFTRCRRQAPTGRHANPTLVGWLGMTKRLASIGVGKSASYVEARRGMSNDRHSRPTAQYDSLPACTVMGGKHVWPLFRCAVSASGGVAMDCVEDRVDRREHCQAAVGST